GSMMYRSIAIFVVITFVGSLLFGDGQTAPRPAVIFEGKDTLLRPEGYREWVFVGSSLGLRYDTDANKPGPCPELYHNVYLNPSSYKHFSQTRTFPDGTVMILELASAEVKKEPGLQGSHQKDFVALEASVKDRRRFDKDWA